MKNKGFTLVEVLGVIVILGLVMVIVYPQISKVLSNQQQKLYNEQIDRYKSLTATYITDNQDKLIIGDSMYIYISDLYNGGYIKGDELINPVTQEELSDACVHILWDEDRNSYDYSYEEVCSQQP